MKYRLRGNFTKNSAECLRELLEARGITDWQSYIHPNSSAELSPYDLENIEAGVKMVLRHLKRNSNICILVDSDCDGFTSAAILWNYIKHIYPNARLSYKLHEGKRHGLADTVEWFEEQNFDLILCPDSSSYDKQEMERLVERGMEVCALDHHSGELEEVFQSPHAIVINNQLSPNYENKELCGAGIVYKFLMVMDDYLNIIVSPMFLDLVAFGNICDVMWMGSAETRYYIMEGLQHITNKGLMALLASVDYRLKGRGIPPYRGLSPIDVAFYCGPAINAVTRVGTLAENEMMFLAFIDPEREVPSTKQRARDGDTETIAEQFARVADNVKARQGRQVERAMNILRFKIAKDNLDANNIIVVEVEPEDEIPQAISGLCAQKILSETGHPCILGRRGGDDVLRGSMRSSALFEHLPSFKEFLENSGYAIVKGWEWPIVLFHLFSGVMFMANGQS